MNNKKDFYLLGKIVKTHGRKGEIVFFLDVDNTDNYKNIESVFIEINSQLVPFFIEKLEFKAKNTAIVKLEDVDSIEQAQDILHSDLYLPLSYLPPLSGNKFYYHEIIGFSVIDQQHGSIGHVKGVVDLSHQAVLQVDFNNKEILIPIVDEIILGVNREKKQLEIKAPEGLIEIYI